MILNLTDVSDEPLHAQISRQVRAKVLAGELEDGASLPSIRGLARDVRVSVITVQRAYNDLEHEGLIRARRGQGFFVTHMSDRDKTALARERFHEALTPVVTEGRAEGLDTGTLRQIFDQVLDATSTPPSSEPSEPDPDPEAGDDR